MSDDSTTDPDTLSLADVRGTFIDGVFLRSRDVAAADVSAVKFDELVARIRAVAALEALEPVHSLHRPRIVTHQGEDGHLRDRNGPCRECGKAWPCPTRRAAQA